MYKSILFNQPWAYLLTLQILLAMTLLSTNLGSVCANAVTPEIPAVSDNENELMMENEQDWSHPWGKREAIFNDDMMNSGPMVPVLAFFANPATMEQLSNFENDNIDDDSILNQKRGWKKMNVAWGKRRNAGYMNRDFAPSASAAGSWGKREPNWNNLKGMWGKRDTPKRSTSTTAGDKWRQLNTGFAGAGKRSALFTETN